MQSTFMIDLQQISVALTLATNRSLLIIDEFGKGTETCGEFFPAEKKPLALKSIIDILNAVTKKKKKDGAGLACGLFDYLLNLGSSRPKVLGATHFHEIFENGFLVKPRPELAFGHMRVQLDDTAANPEDQIAYLYNFEQGRSNASFGTNCAAMNGIDAAIVGRASDISTMIARGEDLVASCAGVSARELSEVKLAEEMAHRLLETDVPSSPASTTGESTAMSVLDQLIGSETRDGDGREQAVTTLSCASQSTDGNDSDELLDTDGYDGSRDNTMAIDTTTTTTTVTDPVPDPDADDSMASTPSVMLS